MRRALLALAASAALVLGTGTPALAASSTGAQINRYSECYPDPMDSSARICIRGNGSVNIVQAANGSFVLAVHDRGLFTYTSPEVGVYTARSNGSFTQVLTAAQMHEVVRFHNRTVFRQTGYADCIAIQNYVAVNGVVRHERDTFDASCFE